MDFSLKGLDVLPEINNQKFSEHKKRKENQNTPIRCIVIEAKSHPDIKLEIFERLNTGAGKSNDDELRNSIYRGPYIELLKKNWQEIKDFQFLLNRPQFHKRMKDRKDGITIFDFFGIRLI